MPRVVFTPHLRSHLACLDGDYPGDTVAAVLAAACDRLPKLRSYLLDDQGRLRQHVAVFVNGQLIADRQRQTDPVPPEGEVYVWQALSGG